MKKKASDPKQTNAAALRAAALVGLLRKKKPPTPKDRNLTDAQLWTVAQTSGDQRTAWMEANKPKFGFHGPNYDNPAESLHVFTWNCLDEPMSPHFPQPGTTWREYAPEALRVRLHETVRHLLYLAASDARAIEHLTESVIYMTESLNKMPPEKLRPVARRQFFWPSLEPKKGKSHHREKLKRLLGKIQHGREVPFNEKGLDSISKNKPAGIEARRLLCRLEVSRKPIVGLSRHIREYREWERKAAALKPFSPGTWREWAQVAIETLLDDHSGHPENDPLLWKIGELRARHSEQTGAQTKATPKTAASNVRQRIVDAIKDVIRTLADCPRKTRKNTV